MSSQIEKEKERAYYNNKGSKCWFCKYSVPRLAKDKYGDYIDGKYVTGCEWSIHKQKVPNWEANLTLLVVDGKEINSFQVINCPKFERG